MTTRRVNRLGFADVRPLGAQITFVEYEWLPSFFRRIGYAFETSAEDIMNWCGLYDLGWSTRKNLPRVLPDKASRGIQAAFGFTDEQLQTMVMGYLPTDLVSRRLNGNPVQSKDWSRGNGTRFCVQCLREKPGVFYTHWRMWWSFICPRHYTLLRAGCSSCFQDIVEASVREREVRNPELCWATGPNGEYCQQRLTDTWDELPVDPDSPALLAQLVLASMWTQTPTNLPKVKALTLRGVGIALHGAGDISRIAELSTIPEEQLNGLIDQRGSNGGIPPSDPLAMAALLGAAYRLIVDPETEMRAHIRETNFNRPVRSAEAVEGPGSGRYLLSFWPDIDERMTGRVLRAFDADLPTMQRLIHGSAASAEVFETFRLREEGRVPDYGLPLAELEADAERHRVDPRVDWSDNIVPRLLWPTWAAPLGVNERTEPVALQIALANALRVAGTSQRPNSTNITGIGKKFRPSMLGNSKQTDAVIRQICELALVHRSLPWPIDYERRLGIPTDQLLLDHHWQILAQSVGESAGAERRIQNARRYAFLRMSGAAPSDLPELLRFRPGSSDVNEYTKFMMTMSAELKSALDDYLRHWLQRFQNLSSTGSHWIDSEPVIVAHAPQRFKHPGAQLAPELDDIDLQALHELIGNGVTSLRTLADAVGRTVRHVRWAISEHPVSYGRLVRPVDWSTEISQLPNYAYPWLMQR